MDISTFPTKSNLLNAKNTLSLSRLGYDLLDKKRKVLIREIMELNALAKDLQERIDKVFTEAYAALQRANIDMGIINVERLMHGVPIEDTVTIKTRGIMGVDIPVCSYVNTTKDIPSFGFGNTSSALDEAVYNFNKVKDLIITLSTVENSAYRLAVSIRKTQKSANALKNVTIPKYEDMVKSIQNTLEERERDDFARLKIIKRLQEATDGD